ncbi:MAG: SMI1/KNR4 family protein [Myxococcales bacterium]|nr:SMI1/KNR4 family protein [Myxococcales bacterium]
MGSRLALGRPSSPEIALIVGHKFDRLRQPWFRNVHRGVRSLIDWIEAHRNGGAPGESPAAVERAPATAADILSVEQQLGMALPEDLKVVLQRYNGAHLPSGDLLPAGVAPGTIGGALRDLATRLHRDHLDSETLLPFFRATDGSMLAFDRGGGPVPDTWPIVDYVQETGDTHLMYRTFDSWCRVSVETWRLPPELSMDTVEGYLRRGQLHVEFEPDIATGHATTAHALRRLGQPEDALRNYLRAGRCVPSLPWVDWEGFKVAALLGFPDAALEAARRLSARGPAELWAQRETTPRAVADVIGRVASAQASRDPWIRCLLALEDQCDGSERSHIMEIRLALGSGASAPTASPLSGPCPVGLSGDGDADWNALSEAYLRGDLRDDHLLLEPTLDTLRRDRNLADLLYLRRDF